MPDALVRPALEAAWLLARTSERTTPGSAPKPLRRLLGHARLTTAALKAVRRVVDDDEGFRSLVSMATSEDAVGRPSWLFLARPDGWEGELAALAAAEAESAQEEEAAREERVATRRLRGAEEALRRAEEALADAKAQAARAAADVADERRSRRAAEEDARALADRLTGVERERAAAVARADELAASLERVAELEAALDDARREQPAPVVPAEAVLEALAAAAVAARTLADTLADAVASFRASMPGEPPDVRKPASSRRGRAGAAHGERRRLAPLPPGIHDDSTEAAEHLVRRRGALLLVDGYNASLRYRPDLPIPELRQRFVDALDELAARTGVDVHVVFDGADVVAGGPPAASSRRGRARVTFSPPDIEADDVILSLVDAVPIGRPVLVASDDRRVRDGADERGANVLSTRQLLAVLRREREP